MAPPALLKCNMCGKSNTSDNPVTYVSVCLNDESFEGHLCDEHRMKLRAAVTETTYYLDTMDSHRPRRAVPVSRHVVPIPRRVSDSEPVLASVEQENRSEITPSLLAAFSEWTWSTHVRRRAKEREIDIVDILLCAQHPEQVRPGKTPETRENHYTNAHGEEIVVVVDVEQGKIVTVYIEGQQEGTDYDVSGSTNGHRSAASAKHS